jgi:hypothetical protein
MFPFERGEVLTLFELLFIQIIQSCACLNIPIMPAMIVFPSGMILLGRGLYTGTVKVIVK